MSFFLGRPDRLRGFRAGQREIAEQVYWTYVDRVEGIVRYGFHLATSRQRVSGAPISEIADIVQEVFARAFSESARLAYDGTRSYAPFLDTIARNVLIDWARRRGRSVELSVEELESVPEPEPEVAWADEDTMREVRAYLSTLSGDLRSVHEQRNVLGRSQADAATALGITRQRLRTLESRLREGLKRALSRPPIR